jgi:phosphoglycolate phosphatase
MTFQLIVFDWDGTLMDSEARIITAMERTLADMGMAPQPPRQIRNVIGLGLMEAIQTLLPGLDQSLQQQVQALYRLHYFGQDRLPSPLFPGAAEVVAGLSAQGYLLAVATGKGRRGLNSALQESGLAAYFHTTRCVDEAPSKPHPDMLLQILDELGVQPQDALMVGDSEYDMQLAANAAVQALAVTCGVHGRERLLRHRPLACLEDVRAIPAWLEHFEGTTGNGLFSS